MPVERDAMRRARGRKKRIGYSKRMETPAPLPERVSVALATVPGVAAVALGGSRATGAAHVASDYDIGLYFSERVGLDVRRLLEIVEGLVDEPASARLTEVGGWGPWIVGGGWLTVAGNKVDLLYRPIESVERVIGDCRDGRISVDYQPGLRTASARRSGWAKSRSAGR
jgi:predicted nucleotidyltransferase